jgi:hypothetical protein
MKKEIIQCAITGEDGETSLSGYYPVDVNLSMTTIAKVKSAEGFVHPDNSLQVSIECDALDSTGSVFELTINFTPSSMFDKTNLLKDFKIHSIYILEGKYGIIDKESVVMYEPEYRPLGKEYIEKDIRMAFRINKY